VCTPSSLWHKSAENLMLEGTTLLPLHYVAEIKKIGINTIRMKLKAEQCVEAAFKILIFLIRPTL
jgi:hypothetical protein